MTILEALRKTVEDIRAWTENKFVKTSNVDSTTSSTSTNPVQNKAITAELNKKISEVNTSISNITSGNTAIQKAIEAESATKATQDASGNVIVNTYETKVDAKAKLTEAKEYVDSVMGDVANSNHNHDSKYDAKGSASAVQSNLDSHTNNADIHVTAANKTNWSAAYTHSTSTHARTDATKVEGSATNGKILVNGTETTVYSHPNSGATAGTYRSVTINAQGHVTAGTNPTTLAGYGITDAESKGAANTALASAKEYADSAANKVKNDLLNGAGGAYDTLKELGDLIEDNKDAIDALEDIAAGKADKTHGTHVTYSTTAPVMDGTASVGSASTVARSDHKHPTDTSRAAQTDLTSHTGNTTVHITSTERTNWNAAKTHADAAHAPSNAEKNQNAFSNITVGSTTVAADTATDTVTFVGTNVTITPDATNDKITFAVADGTTSAKGLVKLTDSVSSTSTTTAATPKNVKAAYDLANQAKTAIDSATADDFGIYVQDTAPTSAVAGDIWIDTANDPAFIAPNLPAVTTNDNGKVLMVVNGKWQAVDLNLSIDANGVVSI